MAVLAALETHNFMFDTHSFIKELTSVGMPEPQARY